MPMLNFQQVLWKVKVYHCDSSHLSDFPEGARWSSGINTANGASGPRFASRILPIVQRPWTNR